ncbi:MAG: cysteine--tRNA ligase [bacterium]|nr:cysteine--tRNA ligase [bacterium]
MALKLYNTLTRKVEPFAPRDPGKVTMYTCGPTVYARAHIGNFRTFLVSDLLRRYLAYSGYDVNWVMNLTDIDDKTIKGANAEGISLREFTDRFIKSFHDDRKTIGILDANLYPRATEHIPEMVKMVEDLIEAKHAYVTDGSAYFKIDSFPTYGQLARLNMEELRVGERVASDEYEKEDVRDFALWKNWEEVDGPVGWETSLGKGRPGWHLECSAMSLKYLGKGFDIHLGGVDLIFPHHQNEIAQTEGVTHEPLARYWVHSEHLLVDGQKMSKSLGNFYTVTDLIEKGWKPREIRYGLLSGHYRQRTNFQASGLDSIKQALARFEACAVNLEHSAGQGGMSELKDTIAQREQEFRDAFDDDLNYPEALAAIFNFVRDANTLCQDKKIGKPEQELAMETMRRFDSVLGYLDLQQETADPESAEIESLIEARNEARKSKNWSEADRARDALTERGIIIEDRAGKTVWRRK